MSVRELRERLVRRITQTDDEQLLGELDALMASRETAEAWEALPAPPGMDRPLTEGTMRAQLVKARASIGRGEGVSGEEFIRRLRDAG